MIIPMAFLALKIAFWGVVVMFTLPLLAADMPKGVFQESSLESQDSPKEATPTSKKPSSNNSQKTSTATSQDSTTDFEKSEDQSPDNASAASKDKSLATQVPCYERTFGILPSKSVLDPQETYVYLLVDHFDISKSKSTKLQGSKKKSPQVSEPKNETLDATESRMNDLRTKKMILGLNLKTGSYEPLVGLMQKRDSVLVLHPGGISAMTFIGQRAECGGGKAMVISIKLGKANGSKAVHHSAQYQLVQSPNGFILGDMAKRQLVQMDGVQFQKRTFRKFLPDGVPLYYNPALKLLVHWVENSDQQGLMYELGTAPKQPKKIAIPRGEGILASMSGVGVIRLEQNKKVNPSKDQFVTIIGLKGLTTGPGGKEYRLKLPQGLKFEELSFDVDFKGERGLLVGKTLAHKKFLQKVWVYKLTKPEPEAVIEPPQETFIQSAFLSSESEYAFFDIRNLEQGSPRLVRTYNFSKKIIKDYPLKLGR